MPTYYVTSHILFECVSNLYFKKHITPNYNSLFVYRVPNLRQPNLVKVLKLLIITKLRTFLRDLITLVCNSHFLVVFSSDAPTQVNNHGNPVFSCPQKTTNLCTVNHASMTASEGVFNMQLDSMHCSNE